MQASTRIKAMNDYFDKHDSKENPSTIYFSAENYAEFILQKYFDISWTISTRFLLCRYFLNQVTAFCPCGRTATLSELVGRQTVYIITVHIIGTRQLSPLLFFLRIIAVQVQTRTNQATKFGSIRRQIKFRVDKWTSIELLRFVKWNINGIN